MDAATKWVEYASRWYWHVGFPDRGEWDPTDPQMPEGVHPLSLARTEGALLANHATGRLPEIFAEAVENHLEARKWPGRTARPGKPAQVLGRFVSELVTEGKRHERWTEQRKARPGRLGSPGSIQRVGPAPTGAVEWNEPTMTPELRAAAEREAQESAVIFGDSP